MRLKRLRIKIYTSGQIVVSILMPANDSYKLIQDLEFGEITHEEALEKNNECH